MPLTNPWLAGPAPTATLPRERLEERILNLLSSQNLAVIATVNADGSPRRDARALLEPRHGDRLQQLERLGEVTQPSA